MGFLHFSHLISTSSKFGNRFKSLESLPKTTALKYIFQRVTKKHLSASGSRQGSLRTKYWKLFI